jgi:hypothetical protein
LSAKKDRLPRNIHVPELSLKSLFEVRELFQTDGFKSGYSLCVWAFPFSLLITNVFFFSSFVFFSLSSLCNEE